MATNGIECALDGEYELSFLPLNCLEVDKTFVLSDFMNLNQYFQSVNHNIKTPLKP